MRMNSQLTTLSLMALIIQTTYSFASLALILFYSLQHPLFQSSIGLHLPYIALCLYSITIQFVELLLPLSALIWHFLSNSSNHPVAWRSVKTIALEHLAIVWGWSMVVMH